MKPHKVLLVAFIVGFLLVYMVSHALAWWEHEAVVEVDNTEVVAIVENSTNRQIFCEGSVYGRTSFGEVLFNSGETVIEPYERVRLQVTTAEHDPFVDGWAQIRCR